MNVMWDGRIGRTEGGERSVHMHVKAVIFDWAGTLVDFGSLAPLLAMRRVFEEAGTPVAADDVRVGMGLGKLEHIRTIASIPHVAKAWAGSHDGRPFDERDAVVLHDRFRAMARQSRYTSSTWISRCMTRRTRNGPAIDTTERTRKKITIGL